MKVSLFRSLFSTKDVSYKIEAVEALERIKDGTSQELIEKIRTEQDSSKRGELKKGLPAVCFNGTFTSRNDNSLIDHSGLCILDFDKYPTDQDMIDERKRLEEDQIVFSVFTSPSGNGLKALVKIPICDKDEHKLYFKALGKHFNSEYFDEKNCNVSRVCFESYDPNIYINLDSVEFTEKATEEGYSVDQKVPVLPLSSENEIVSRLVKWWGSNYGLIPGSKNNNLFILASSFCNYGIDQDYALNYMMSSIVMDEKKRNEVSLLTRSAYKTADFGTKYFEDTATINRIKTKVSKGQSIDTIAKSFPTIDRNTLEEVNDEFKSNSSEFWDITINKQGIEIVTINPNKYKSFLEENGFNKFYPEGGDVPLFVHHEQNIVNTTSVEKIKDFVLRFLESKNEWSVWNYCAKSTMLFKETYLNMLDSICLSMLQDSKDCCYLYFKNGVVQILNDKVNFLSYINVNGFVWQNQIIERDFTQSDKIENDFKDLVSKVSADDPTRINALENTIGYLMSSFKDKSYQKAIILNDQEINDDPNGGSGKSLMLNALGQFKKMVTINGKKFDPNGSDFVYQRINVDTQILAFDDVKKNFSFDALFSIITEGIEVNQKNKAEFVIPFERSPKIVITTNYVINGSGGSHDRRRHELEFFQYFSAKHSPINEYGRLLFDEWSESDWISFDNYMISITQKFLNQGLTDPVSINADLKRFIQQTSKDFYDWIEDGNLQKDSRLYNTETNGAFKEEHKEHTNMNNRTFLNWIGKYCELNDYKLNKGRDHRGRFFEIATGTKKIDTNPF